MYITHINRTNFRLTNRHLTVVITRGKGQFAIGAACRRFSSDDDLKRNAMELDQDQANILATVFTAAPVVSDELVACVNQLFN